MKIDEAVSILRAHNEWRRSPDRIRRLIDALLG